MARNLLVLPVPRFPDLSKFARECTEFDSGSSGDNGIARLLRPVLIINIDVVIVVS